MAPRQYWLPCFVFFLFFFFFWKESKLVKGTQLPPVPPPPQKTQKILIVCSSRKGPDVMLYSSHGLHDSHPYGLESYTEAVCTWLPMPSLRNRSTRFVKGSLLSCIPICLCSLHPALLASLLPYFLFPLSSSNSLFLPFPLSPTPSPWSYSLLSC